MAEEQARHMQQVAESSSFSTVGKVLGSGGDLWPEGDRSRPAPFADRLRRAVENEIIPRVNAVRGSKPLPAPGVDPATDGLVDLLIRAQRDGSAERYVDGLVERGLPVHQIFLNLFQPAARKLGDLWLDDIASFVDVTLGMATLQTLLRRLAPMLYANRRPATAVRSVVLTTLPGDQHTFGVSMAAEFFRHAGWSVSSDPWSDPRELADRLRADKHAVVGFSAAGEERLDELAAAIRCVRRAGKRNPVGIMVGGPLFASRPELAVRIGADVVGLDAQQSLAEAEALAKRIEYG